MNGQNRTDHMKNSTSISSSSSSSTSVDQSAKTSSSNPSHQVGTSESQTKTLVEAVTEKLAPDYATISDASQLTRISSAQRLMCISKPLTVTPSNEDDTDLVEDLGDAYGVYEENRSEEKKVSVSEYISDKLEPGEDERVLSKVISEAFMPGDMGVMEKVKEVMTSLLLAEQEQEEREEEERQKQQQQRQQEEEQEQQRVAQSMRRPSTSSSQQIPVSTNAYEGEEETQGRILQAN